MNDQLLYSILCGCHITVLVYLIFVDIISTSPVSDLGKAEPVIVILALFLLKSNDEVFDLVHLRFCYQGF